MILKRYAEFIEEYSAFQEEIGSFIEELISRYKTEILAPVVDGIVYREDLEEISDNVIKYLRKSTHFSEFIHERKRLLKKQAEILAELAKLQDHEIGQLIETEVRAALAESLLVQFEESGLFDVRIDDEEEP